MKNRLVTGLLMASVAALAGCGKDGTPGGPGTTDTRNKPPLIGQADDTFTLSTSSVSVKPGATTQSSASIKRGSKFEQDVALEFADLPKGVTIDPAKPVLANKTSEVKFNVIAGDDAAPGEYTVRLHGRPTTGPNAENQIKLTVGKRDSFTLGVPFWTTGVKQGETKVFDIAVRRDGTFDQEVTLKFDGLPKGVTVEPSKAVAKNGEKDVKLTLKVADDAPLGKHTVKITGHPAKGDDVTHDFTFEVSKK